MLDLVSMQFCIVAYFDLAIAIHDHIHEEHRCKAIEEDRFTWTYDQLIRRKSGKVLLHAPAYSPPLICRADV